MGMKRFSTLFFTVAFLAQQVSQAGPALTLEDFLNQVQDKNLGLKVESAKTDAASARAIGLAIPAPMVGLIQMKEEGGGKASGFEVNQTIPFPTRLWSERSARKFEATSQEESRKAFLSETLANARLLYFSIWAAKEKVDLLKEKKAAIAQHIKLSRAGSRSDSFSNIHILKAETDVDELDNDIVSAEQTLRNKQIETAEYINADPGQFHPEVKEPRLADLPTSSIEAPHQIEAAKLTLESFKSRESGAASSWLPEFGLRYKKMGPSSMNARYTEVMVSASLPFVFFWEPHAAKSSAAANTMQAEFELERETRKVQTKKASLEVKAASLKKQIETLNSKVLPRAEKRMRLIHNLAPRDMETLQDHREAMEAFPELKLKALEYREQYEEAIAELQKYARNKDTQ